MRYRRRVRGLRWIVVVACAPALTGCGFIHAGTASHNKPSGFDLRGYVSVAGATTSTAPGTPCASPPGAADVHVGAPIQVTSPDGRLLATGRLGAGVLALDSATGHCDFPFQIDRVPGGPTAYVLRVGGRPPVSFPASGLREDKPAVIEVPAATGSP